jgi:putative FmdB family regulatory protein
MPNYDYGCQRCGQFSMSRPMAEYDRPQDCPGCGLSACRILSGTPAIAGMDAGRRLALSTNERSAHAPQRSTAGAGDRADCGCCKGRRPSKLKSDAARSFPARRPWMISH